VEAAVYGRISSYIRRNAIGTDKIVTGAVRSGDVLDADLTGTDIANDLDGDFNDRGQDDVSADRLGGIEEEDFVYASPSLSTNPPNSIPGLRWRGFFLATDESDDDLALAGNRIVVENVGAADQFRSATRSRPATPPRRSSSGSEPAAPTSTSRARPARATSRSRTMGISGSRVTGCRPGACTPGTSRTSTCSSCWRRPEPATRYL
jgi:hypothetical protein